MLNFLEAARQQMELLSIIIALVLPQTISLLSTKEERHHMRLATGWDFAIFGETPHVGLIWFQTLHRIILQITDAHPTHTTLLAREVQWR